MSHDPWAWWDIRAIRKGEQRSVKTSGELGGTVIDECARCALMSHNPWAWWDIRAIRKDEQRSVKTSGELGGTVDLRYGTLGCWASASSKRLAS